MMKSGKVLSEDSLSEDRFTGGTTPKMVLIRVGVDSGRAAGGTQGPLFADESFEFVPIPDGHGVGESTYGNTVGRHGRALSEYFPARRQAQMADMSMHNDPEFETFTYGDPSVLKRRLRWLQSGDLVVFYAGLEDWDFPSPPALYLIGFFEVKIAGMALDFDNATLQREFGQNFHVRYPSVFEDHKRDLVLVKGTSSSRLFQKAHLISEVGADSGQKPLKVLSIAAQKVFGDFGGRVSIQRSPPRWIAGSNVPKAMSYVRALK